MVDRRQFITGIAAASVAGIAGCTDPEEEDVVLPPDSSELVVLPPDSSELFLHGTLQRNFAESSFTEDQVGTAVSEFDLVNADTSNVEDMSSMFRRAELFDQDIGGWDTGSVEDMSWMFWCAESFDQDISTLCVEDIAEQPDGFDTNAGFGGSDTKQPNWGEPC